MDALDLLKSALQTNDYVVNLALEGLTDEDLAKRPSEQDNPAGWLLWHNARVEDSVVAHATGGAQAWTEGKWHERFGMEADPKNVGLGHKLEQVKAFRAAKADLQAYAGAVREKTLAALDGMTPEGLDRMLPDVTGGEIRVGDLLARALLVDKIQHSGQVAFLRGYITGFGWMPF